MKIADYAINHPAVVGILLIAVALFGAVSLTGLSRELVANVELPEILVVTVYPGASPEVVEREVTEILEEELSLIEGIDSVGSSSHRGYSTVSLSLDWSADRESAKNDIRDKINNAMADLPDGTLGRPSLYDLGVGSIPIYTILVEYDTDPARFALTLEDDIVPRFSRLPGVSAVSARGVEADDVRVRLDPAKLDALEITALEAYAAVARGQGTVPAGDALAGPDFVPVESDGDYIHLEQIRNQPVGYDTDGTRIRVSDVASVSIEPGKAEFRVFSAGKRAAAIDILKRPGADTDALVEGARELQETITKETGGSVRFVPVMDNARDIDITLGSVSRSAWLGGLLAVVILLLFLHDIRAALIVVLSIPFTVFLTFIFLRIRGMSLNIMVLAGITVSIGMIVDASIVILENTVRHHKGGIPARRAASVGANEVGSAVLASTSTSLSVFIPILFLTGFAGSILKEVAWTLIFALASSAITAVVIVPWLAHRILDAEGFHPLARFGRGFDRVFGGLTRAYERLLTAALRNRGFVLILAASLIIAGILALSVAGGELFSAPDFNEFEIEADFPPGYDLDRADAKLREIADVVRREVPEIEADLWYAGLSDSNTIVSAGNPSTGYGRVRISRTVERERTVFEIIDVLRTVLPAEIPDAEIRVRNGGAAKLMNYATDGEGIRVEVYGTRWDDVLATAEGVREIVAADPMVAQSAMGVRLDYQVMAAALRREHTGRLAVDPVAAGRNLRILFSGESAGTFRTEGVSRDIVVDSTLSGAAIPDGILGRIRIRNGAGETVPYSAFAGWERREAVDRIPHRDRMPSIMVTGYLSDTDLRGVRTRVETALASFAFPPGVRWRLAGAADIMEDIFRDLGISLAISVFLVYMVMVIQFERFDQPFIIMAAVPFTLIGVAVALLAFGSRMTMMAFFGIIALGGMVVNNAIVLVDYANRLRNSEGMDLREAIVRAGSVRLKPILITTLTTILGIVPLAFAVGEGSALYSPLGQVIGGGLLTSTLITLILVPILYDFVEGRKENRARARREDGQRMTRSMSAAPLLILISVIALSVLVPGNSYAQAVEAKEEYVPPPAGGWSVDDLVARALDDDPALLGRRGEAAAAQQRLRGTKSLRWPTLDVGVATSYLSDPLLSVDAGALGSLPNPAPPPTSIPLPSEDLDVWGTSNDFRYDIEVILEQPVFLWGKISSGVRAAEAGGKAAGFAVLAREEDIRYGIVSGLEGLTVIEEMVRLTAEQEVLGDRLAELTLRNFEEGFLLETEYRDARNRLQQILLTRSGLLEERRSRLLDLEAVTGLSDLTVDDLRLPAVDISLESYSLPDVEILVAMAMNNNTSLRLLRTLENQAEAELAYARGEAAGKPDVALRAEFGYGGGFGRAPDDIDGTWTVTLGARTRLFDAGYARSGIREAEERRDVSRQRSEEGRRSVNSAIRGALYGMTLNQDNIAYFVGLAETDAARSAQKRTAWESGYGREEEFLLAELDFLAAEIQRYREITIYLAQDRAVRRAAGISF